MPMRVHGHVGVLQGLKTSILPRLGIGATAHTIINVSRSPHPYWKRFATGNQLLLRAHQTPLYIMQRCVLACLCMCACLPVKYIRDEMRRLQKCGDICAHLRSGREAQKQEK